MKTDGGVGWIARDSLGSPIEAGCTNIQRNWPIKSLEALAIREGLSTYLSTNQESPLRVIVESDSMEIVGP